MLRRSTETMIMIEGKNPPSFGLITPDALSPCLFTWLQHPGHEGVNKASSLSTASITTSVRHRPRLWRPCQKSLSVGEKNPAEDHRARWIRRSTTKQIAKQRMFAVRWNRIDHTKQHCNKKKKKLGRSKLRWLLHLSILKRVVWRSPSRPNVWS